MVKPSNPTPMVRPDDNARAWHLLDATDLPVGRLASRVAAILRGKHKPTYSPHWDHGDYVVIVNAERVRFTGNKWNSQMYYRHSGYPGGLKGINAAAMRAKHPERILEAAVRGMLPKNRLGRAMFKKLKVYAGPAHPHEAQRPQPLTLE